MLVRTLTRPEDGPAPRRAHEIYDASFPAEERLPAGEVLDRRSLDRTVDLAVVDDQVQALAVTVPHPRVGAVLLEYLAVDPSTRSSGLGGRLLDHVVDRAGGQLLLAELEPTSSSPDAGRRGRFYERHGFAPAPWQGGYGMPSPTGDGFVPLELWCPADAPHPADPVTLVREVYTRTYADRGRPHLDRVLASTRPAGNRPARG